LRVEELPLVKSHGPNDDGIATQHVDERLAEATWSDAKIYCGLC